MTKAWRLLLVILPGGGHVDHCELVVVDLLYSHFTTSVSLDQRPPAGCRNLMSRSKSCPELLYMLNSNFWFSSSVCTRSVSSFLYHVIQEWAHCSFAFMSLFNSQTKSSPAIPAEAECVQRTKRGQLKASAGIKCDLEQNTLAPFPLLCPRS